MPQLHMPLQSGSDAIAAGDAPLLPQRAVSGHYRRKVRAAMPEAAITTDIIVGFPGETEADFRAHSRRGCGGAILRQLSPSSTPSDREPRLRPWMARFLRRVVQERYDRLVDLVGRNLLAEKPEAESASGVEVMFADGEGRKDTLTHRMSGRARDNRLVHVSVPQEPAERPRPGDVAEVIITLAAPHHLTADAGLLALRRTCGGDAWQATSVDT